MSGDKEMKPREKVLFGEVHLTAGLAAERESFGRMSAPEEMVKSRKSKWRNGGMVIIVGFFG